MTEQKNLSSDLIPRELLSFLKKRHCPLCKKSLVINDELIVFKLMNINNAFTECSNDPTHYYIDLYWHDPKFIMIHSEELDFDYNDKNYNLRIEKSNLSSDFLTSIKIESDEYKEPIYLELKNEFFDLKRFKIKDFIKKVQLYLTFQ